METRIRNITRYDSSLNPSHAFKGWRVHLVCNGEKNCRYFSDRQYRSAAKAQRAAKQYLKELKKKYGLI